jgi:hypothetical protein
MGKVLHASFSGYFPTCITSGTPTPPEEYLSLTLERAMALFWRVRTWEAKASGSFNDASISSNIEYTANSFEEMGAGVVIEEEKNLVCKGNENFYFAREATGTITPDGGTPFDFDGILNFQYVFSSIKSNGTNYYPNFYISFINSITSFYTSKIGTYNFKYLDNDLSGDLFGTDGSSGNALIEIRAKEYWSYGGTYNTTTGEPL